MTEFFSRLVKEKPLRIIAGVVIPLLILVAIFADVLAPFPHGSLLLPTDRGHYQRA